MSLKLVSSEKLNKIIRDSYTYPLEIEKEGVYLIEVTASAKSWWQNLLAKFRGGRLKLQIGGELFDQNASKWNGNLLKGLSKTIVFILPLRIGCYCLRFLAENKPYLAEIRIYQVTDQKVTYHLLGNNPAQVGDCRPWYSIIFQGQLLRGFAIIASCKEKSKQTNPKDDDDLQLVIDGKIVNNNDKRVNKKHQYWFWCGDLLKGHTKSYSIEKRFTSGYHTLEFNADRSPAIDVFYLNIAMPITSQLLPIVKPYKSLNGEDYNKFDEEIYNAVKFWNDEFTKQKFPPPEPLDPNLVKAIAYKESRVGNDINAGIDIMQVWDEENGTPQTIKGIGVYLANEFISDKKYGHMSYNYPKEYLPAKVDKPKESIFWGVRWLYHKAQYLDQQPDGSLIYPYVRKWTSWSEAVINYNANDKEKVKYQKDVLNLYEKGIDPHRKNSRLWTYVTLLFVGWLIIWQANSYYGVQSDYIPDLITDYVRDQGQVKGTDTDLFNGMSQTDFVDNLHREVEARINIYPLSEGQNQKLFQSVVNLVSQEGPNFQEVFDQYTDELIEKTENLNQFIEAATTLHIIRENAWEMADFDGDGRNELVFLQDDLLNRGYIKVYLVDKYYSTRYQLIDFMISDSNFSSINSSVTSSKPLMILNVADDPTPEILVFTDKGHNGTRLTILQYDESSEVLEQIFNYSNKFYTECIFADYNHNGLLEMNIKNRSSNFDDSPVFFNETFEYNSERGRFELTETVE